MKHILPALLLAASVPALAAKPAPAPVASYKTEADKAAYGIGYFTGKANVQHLENLNVDAYVAGFRDAYAKKNPVMGEEEMKTVLDSFKQKLAAEAAAKAKAEAAANKTKADAYLQEHGKQSGVTTTASGLQYEVLTAGNGPKPKETDVVRVHYHGTLTDGTVFDSSVQRGEPASFQLNQVIDGWVEGLQLMPVGSKYRFTLPPQLAYGEQGAGPIPPNSVLVFEVELLGIDTPVRSDTDAAPATKGKKKK